MRGESEGEDGFLPSLGTRGLLPSCGGADSCPSGLFALVGFTAFSPGFPRAGGAGAFVLEAPSLLPKMFSGPITDFSYCSRF